MLREPVVAGVFYEGEPSALRRKVEALLGENEEKIRACAIICPHAGYVYSGLVAGAVYSSVKIPDTVVILGPNHTGNGAPVSVMHEGIWRTPLGDVRINTAVAEKIIYASKFAEKDAKAHLREHSIEVQLPFLQVLKAGIQIVPVVIRDGRKSVLCDLGCSIAKAIEGTDTLIISSTDLTHYEAAGVAREKDMAVLDAVVKMDPEAMLETVETREVSMCGWMPTYTALYAAKMLGAKEGRLIRYSHSGEAGGDMSEVVGYGGAVII